MSKKRKDFRKRHRSKSDARRNEKYNSNRGVKTETESEAAESRDVKIRTTNRRQLLIASILLFVGAVAVYIHSVSFGFIYDDHKLIVRPAAPESLSEALHVFAERHWDNLPYYRPIARFTMVAQMALHGDNPGPFHAFNAVLMGICALAAFWLLSTPVWRIPIWFAAAAAALFVLHPVSSCTVYPICSGRETLIPAIFVITSLACWLRGGQYYWPAILFLACALFSKEQSVVLPALMLVADSLGISRDAPGRNLGRWVVKFLPIVAVTAVYFLIRRSLFEDSNEHHLAVFDSPLVPLQSVLFALQSWFAPFVDLHYEPRWEVWFTPWRSVVGIMATLTIIYAYFLLNYMGSKLEQLRVEEAKTKKSVAKSDGEFHKGVQEDGEFNSLRSTSIPHHGAVFAFWIVWVAFSLAPTVNILHQECRFAERYVFLALLGPLAIAAIALGRITVSRGSRNIVFAIAAILVIGCGAISFHRGSSYVSDNAFLNQWVKVDPDSLQARVTLGEHLFESGDIENAKQEFETVLKLNSNEAAANHALGYLLMMKENRLNEALKLLELSVAVKNDYPEAHNSLGIAHSMLRNYKEAEVQYKIAISQSPNFAEPHVNLGQMYSEQGKPELARASFQEALRIDAQFANAHAGLALLDVRAGNLRTAAAGFQKATELDPLLVEAFLNLGRVNVQLGEWQSARDAYERALELDPNSELARVNLNELNKQ